MSPCGLPPRSKPLLDSPGLFGLRKSKLGHGDIDYTEVMRKHDGQQNLRRCVDGTGLEPYEQRDFNNIDRLFVVAGEEVV